MQVPDGTRQHVPLRMITYLTHPQPSCSAQSVGVLIVRNDHLLLGERAKEPSGWAPPAGHVDLSDRTPAAAAQREVREEVNLTIDLPAHPLLQRAYENTCRRGTPRHAWTVYQVHAEGEPHPKADELKQLRWVDHQELVLMCNRTRRYLRKEISDTDWRADPGLEPVWVEILGELSYIP
ncbi:MAG: NUDIX hydrolase [Candidatus Andersenbacteria bacterium]